MTKQEVIQEEYIAELSKDLINKEIGLELFKNLQPYIKENGWINTNESEGYTGYLMESDLEVNFPFLRLKSLQGIENNNGWIKIENEYDLPKESGYYNFQKFPQENYKPNITYWSKGATRIRFWLESYTHYEPLIKSNPPLY